MILGGFRSGGSGISKEDVPGYNKGAANYFGKGNSGLGGTGYRFDDILNGGPGADQNIRDYLLQNAGDARLRGQ